MIVKQLAVGPFQENTYFVADEKSDAAVLIDPGSDADRIIETVEQSGKKLRAIWITHAHLDHIGALAAIKRKWNVPVYMHPLDEPLFRVAGRQAELYGLPFDEPPAPDNTFSDGDTLSIGNLRFSVMHAPGHAPGHVVIHGEGVVFAGDCLFAGSIGRTDLPFSKAPELAQSLKKIAGLPRSSVVYSGHGPETTIGEELQSNPFLNGTASIAGSQEMR
jgi:hydroxyacylglutathione hydrolase